jgi:hypothetical protein
MNGEADSAGDSPRSSICDGSNLSRARWLHSEAPAPTRPSCPALCSLVPGIHVLLSLMQQRRGWPGIGERKRRRSSNGHRRAEATPFFERLCPAMTTWNVAPTSSGPKCNRPPPGARSSAKSHTAAAGIKVDLAPQYASLRAAAAIRCTPDWTGGAILPAKRASLQIFDCPRVWTSSARRCRKRHAVWDRAKSCRPECQP